MCDLFKVNLKSQHAWLRVANEFLWEKGRGKADVIHPTGWTELIGLVRRENERKSRVV